MMYENIRDVPGNYVTCHFAGYLHKHTVYIPKYLLEVRPGLFFFFLLQTLFFSFGFFLIPVYFSWRPQSLFLESRSCTHKSRHCDLSIIIRIKLLRDPLSQCMMSRKIPRRILDVGMVQV